VTREEAASATDYIEPGYYVTKLVRGGPEVPCRIIETDGWWLLLVCGTATTGAAIENPFTDRLMCWVARSDQISEDRYDEMLKAAAAAKPGEPLADPTSRVDWRRAPPLY
jgi:hypothetical protein